MKAIPEQKQQNASFDGRVHHSFVRFEIFTVVTMKNAVFWNVAPCGFCRFSRKIPEDGILHHNLVCGAHVRNSYI
jgi:hypothetical protein